MGVQATRAKTGAPREMSSGIRSIGYCRLVRSPNSERQPNQQKPHGGSDDEGAEESVQLGPQADRGADSWWWTDAGLQGGRIPPGDSCPVAV